MLLLRCLRVSAFRQRQCDPLLAASFRSFATKSPLDKELDLDEADWRSSERELHSLLRVPSSGHSVFLVQPYVKWGQQRRRNTRPEYQLAESVALVNTLPGWNVSDAVVVPVGDLASRRTSLLGTGKLDELKVRNRSISLGVSSVCVSEPIILMLVRVSFSLSSQFL
jgi:hypothetical protein